MLALTTASMFGPSWDVAPRDPRAEEEPPPIVSSPVPRLPDLVDDEPDAVTLEHTELMLQGAHGVQLHAQWWRPCGRARGVVVVVHGLKDHGSRYGELAERLVARGFAVHAFDLRGHAHSGGQREWVESFDDYVRDLDVVVRNAMAREGSRPMFVFGQGMGGTIAAIWAVHQRTTALSGLVLSGARLQSNAAPASAPRMRLLAALAPHAGTFQIDVRRASRDRGTVEDTLRDALIHHEPAPARTARELLDATARLDAHAPSLTVPLLAMHGSRDELEDPKGSRRLVERAGGPDKQLYLYDGLAHDLVHEPERGRVVRDVAAWLTDHLPSLPVRRGYPRR